MRPHRSYIPRTRDAETEPKGRSEHSRWVGCGVAQFHQGLPRDACSSVLSPLNTTVWSGPIPRTPLRVTPPPRTGSNPMGSKDRE